MIPTLHAPGASNYFLKLWWLFRRTLGPCEPIVIIPGSRDPRWRTFLSRNREWAASRSLILRLIPTFRKRPCTCCLTLPSVSPRALPISLLLSPSQTNFATCCCRGVRWNAGACISDDSF